MGDGSLALSRLQPGTRVMVEGPYGRLHAGVRTRAKVLLDLTGITPMRALLEDLRAAARRRRARLPRPAARTT